LRFGSDFILIKQRLAKPLVVYFVHGRVPQVKTSRVSVALDAWSKRQAEARCLPNLGLGGTFVAIFICSYFSALIGNALLVIIFYGPHAFFIQGIHVSDWKHGVLSNGAHVGPLTGIMSFIWWAPLIACAEIAAGFLSSFLRAKPWWLSAVAQFLGGSVLLTFSGWLVFHDGVPKMHPILLAALIGGGVMIWRAIRSVVTA
jgi:hypothetical protein